VDELARRWLAVQRDLGGDELITDTPIVVAASEPETPVQASAERTPPRRAKPLPGAPRGIESVVPQEPEPIASVGPAIVPKRYADGDVPAYLKDAPGIPPAGLIVTLPPSPAAAWPTLEAVAETVAECRACPLCADRTNTVPGEGNPTASLMVVGEGPGEQEDLSGRPFVGRAGELLDKMLLAIETPRPTVYIANVVKCRPPRNRTPLPDERAACLPYLHRQIALVRPKVLLALGTTAAEALLGVKKPLGDLRLKVHRLDGIPLVVTYHPAALLRNPNWKRPAWDDVRIARQLLDALG
jgi:DNA polymerase